MKFIINENHPIFVARLGSFIEFKSYNNLLKKYDDAMRKFITSLMESDRDKYTYRGL